MTCELGKETLRNLVIENPTSKQFILHAKPSNSQVFEIIPDKIIVPPYEAAEFAIRFCPNALDHFERATLELYSKKAGTWVYRVTGNSTAPSEMETTIITSEVLKSSSQQLNFRNPFNEPLNIDIYMVDETDTFQLLLKRTKFLVPPIGVLLIPVSYLPHTMQETSTEVSLCKSTIEASSLGVESLRTHIGRQDL